MQNQNLTGYPSIDKPWLKYYDDVITNMDIPLDTLYRFVKSKNSNNMQGIALEYFGKTITYEQLFEISDKAALGFGNIGILRGDIVSLCALNTPETFASVLGLNKIGAVCNIIEPRTNATQIIERINAVKSKVLVIIDIFFNKIKHLLKDCCADTIIVYSLSDSMNPLTKVGYYIKTGHKIDKISFANNIISWKNFIELSINKPYTEAVEFKEKTPAVIVYTGGTTGLSKGAVLPNESFCYIYHYKYISNPKYLQGQSFLNIMPPFIAYGIMFGMVVTLAFGLKIILIPAFNVEEFPRLVKKYRPNHIVGVPSFFEKLTESKLLKNSDLSYLKGIITGGDYMTEQSELKINSFMKKHNSGAVVHKGYGMTELASGALYTASEESNIPGTIGIPLLPNNIKVIDVETGQELKYGEKGEICIQSPAMMLEYYNNPEETKKVIKIHEDGNAWVHTQDIGYVKEDGTIYIIGRMKRMIIRPDGHNVWPSAMENVINGHKSVAKCVVVGLSNAEGNSGKIPTAFIELKDDFSGDKRTVEKELDAMCRQQLPERDIPWQYRFVDKLPLTSVGKIDYRKLEEME